MILDKKGFTLVEVMVVSAIMAILLLASSQATIVFVKEMQRIEKKQEVVSEIQEMDMFIRRSARNLNMSRLNMPTTFYQTLNTGAASLGSNAVSPAPSMIINPQEWAKNAQGSHLYEKATEAISGTAYDIILDSFLLEEHRLTGSQGGMQKRTKRLMVARCDEADNAFEIDNKFPGITALYVLGAMKRRPFITHRSDGTMSVTCCLPNSPNCTEGSVSKFFFKAYSIDLDNNERVISVQEFPKSNAGNPVVGAGFGMFFKNVEGTNVAIETFTVQNNCYLRKNAFPGACENQIELKQFLKMIDTYTDLVRVTSKSISTTISNDILRTGVISL
ncbi:hypothetical protein AZI87_03745 [Bdellovibrio bacteriovorus]|uniref:Prepilin-type N-terminal cleavage/methylation domain-containing protein n=1 Tax=Bdellovibrio bacteriovorus TaxID=959 RepID=A0A162GKG6_BDEBC|nr:prepilin-type N-terminal cleavage/methylation domain-containing protein [Bdellovibrio bacteriovorus]KYG68373.1 hypothetical protein AZI87_03745 [Bdellovibrio bacteriovorus]